MNHGLRRSYLSGIYILLYLPIAVLVLYSFNTARFSLRWHGFSMHWYHELFQDTDLWFAFFHSLLLGLSASLIASGLGFFACIHFFLTQRINQHLLYTLLLLIVLPDLVLGVALLVFFNIMQIPLGFFSLLIAHITFCLPFVIITISTRLQALDVNLYFSALDLGATRITALTRILLPLVWPAVLSAVLLSFTLSFDDVIISYFVSGPEFNILPLTIYSLVRTGVTPELNALCSITLLLSMLLVIFAHRLARRTP